tara:strand:+ start:8319 stop:8543 length:225 start_codon:yes stop_codon:yes gene_type:complete
MPAFDDMELDARPDWNELEEHIIAKKNLVNKLTNIKAPSLTHKAKRVVSTVKNTSLHGNDNKSDMSKVGTDSSQ